MRKDNVPLTSGLGRPQLLQEQEENTSRRAQDTAQKRGGCGHPAFIGLGQPSKHQQLWAQERPIGSLAKPNDAQLLLQTPAGQQLRLP